MVLFGTVDPFFFPFDITHLPGIELLISFSQLCWGQLHACCFSIPTYPRPNPQIGCSSSSLSSLLLFMSFSVYPLLACGGLSTYIEIFSLWHCCWPVLDMSNPSQMNIRFYFLFFYNTRYHHHFQVSLNLSPIDATPKCS